MPFSYVFDMKLCWANPRTADMRVLMAFCGAVVACGASPESEQPPPMPDPTIRFEVMHSLDFDCTGPDCHEAYWQLPEMAETHLALTARGEIVERACTAFNSLPQPSYWPAGFPSLQSLVAGTCGTVLGATPPMPPPLSASELRDLVVDGLGVRFLIEGANERFLVVTEYERIAKDGYERIRLRFNDPYVGDFEVRILDPGTATAAIVALHGHGESGDVMEDRFMGADLARRGYLVVLPQFRAMDCATFHEGELSMFLMEHGFTLMGLQVYETILSMRYVRSLEYSRIGVIGHSGGASTSNLLTRIYTDLSAHVTDHQVEWRNFCSTGLVHCESIPALFDLHPIINDASTRQVPFLAVPYAYANPTLRDDIAAFFDTHLSN